MELGAADGYRASLNGRMMMDNPLAAMELLEQLEEMLPLSARLTPELRANLIEQNAGVAVPSDCAITGLHYLRARVALSANSISAPP